MSDTLGKVSVLGIGKTGVDVARYLMRNSRADEVWVYAGSAKGASVKEKISQLASLQIHVVADTEEVKEDFDLCIASPGISMNSAFFRSAKAHAKEIIGEPEFAFREHPNNWLAITGTNGKTTTTTLLAKMLTEAGLPAIAVGNIGRLCTLEVDHAPADKVFVAELSSFQLAETKTFHPKVAILLNITPDHLEWHGSLEAYAEAKAMIFANQGEGDVSIASVDDAFCQDIAAGLRGSKARFVALSVKDDFDPAKYSECAYLDGDTLKVILQGTTFEIATMAEMPIKGKHNAKDALAASAAALAFGAPLEAVRKALLGFKSLPHRIEFVARVDGIDYVNDSKATNTDSVEAALTAFKPKKVVLMLGGHDKGTELEHLARTVCDSCYAAICYGEAGPRIYEALKEANADGTLKLLAAPHMREAFSEAVGVARAGDTVLLSPACSSFDEFKNMGERGVLFRSLVATLQEDKRGTR